MFTPCGARADDKQEIRDLYAKLRLAIMGKLPEGVLGLQTPDFHSKGLDGKPAGPKDLVRQMKLPEEDVSQSRMDLLIYKFNITPPTAVVPFRYYFSLVVVDRAGKLGAKGRRHSLSTTGLIHCDLVKTPVGWKFKSMESQTGSYRVDGKLPGAAAGARRGGGGARGANP